MGPHLTGLITSNVCACPNVGYGFPTSYVVGFYVHWFGVRGDCYLHWDWFWILDHQCLNVLFIIWQPSSKNIGCSLKHGSVILHNVMCQGDKKINLVCYLYFVNCSMVYKKSSTTSATYGEGTADPSGAHEFTPGIQRDLCY